MKKVLILLSVIATLNACHDDGLSNKDLKEIEAHKRQLDRDQLQQDIKTGKYFETIKEEQQNQKRIYWDQQMKHYQQLITIMTQTGIKKDSIARAIAQYRAEDSLKAINQGKAFLYE